LIVKDSPVELYVPEPNLATGLPFIVENNWKNAIQRTQFCNYIATQPEDIQEKWLEGLSEATVEFLNQTKMVCFARPPEDNFSEDDNWLSLMVSTRSDLQAQQPRLVDKKTLQINLQAINNGIGKVFAVLMTKRPSYQLVLLPKALLTTWSNTLQLQ
jgi:hypothetical protein